MQFASISDDIIAEIFGFLSAPEVFSASQTCKSLADLKNNNLIWQNLCANVWLIKEKHEEESWLAVYHRTFELYGASAVPVYARLGRVWRGMEQWLSDHAPDIYQSLERPMSALEFAQAKARARTLEEKGYPVPPEFLLSCTFHNGQKRPTDRDNITPGLFGGASIYDLDLNYHLAGWSTCDFLASALAIEPNVMKLFPCAVSMSTMNSLMPFCFDEEGSVGRVSADGVFRECAPSFIEFMETHLTLLEGNILHYSPRTGISRFPDPDPLGCDTVTQGVRIRVSSILVPEQCSFEDPESYLFAYRVRISYVKNDDMKCTLTTRHWVITDAEGHTEEVKGPGVVGVYPTVYQGMDEFEYVSCCPLSTQTGEMRGSFQFEVESTGETFDAVINTFRFDVDNSFI